MSMIICTCDNLIPSNAEINYIIKIKISALEQVIRKNNEYVGLVIF